MLISFFLRDTWLPPARPHCARAFPGAVGWKHHLFLCIGWVALLTSCSGCGRSNADISASPVSLLRQSLSLLSSATSFTVAITCQGDCGPQGTVSISGDGQCGERSTLVSSITDDFFNSATNQWDVQGHGTDNQSGQEVIRLVTTGSNGYDGTVLTSTPEVDVSSIGPPYPVSYSTPQGHSVEVYTFSNFDMSSPQVKRDRILC